MPEAPAWKFRKLLQDLAPKTPLDAVLTGRVITGVGDEVIEDGYVRIEGGAITAVGANDGSAPPADVRAIETSGTILPGLINSHAHLAWDGIHDLADLGMNQSNVFAKQAVQQGIFPGPRLLICGEAIVQTGGHTYWCCREASGADEMRRAVREQVRHGADLIKIMICHDRLEFTDEELAAVVDETHRQGLPITSHATFDAAIARAVEFGVDVIEHGGSMSDETIDLLVSRGVPIVTTFSPLAMQSQPEVARQYNIPEWKIAERQAAVADKSRFDGLVRAARAGVRIVFGTDAGSPAVRHETVVPEMEFMVYTGVVSGNHGAIMSATREAAAMNGLDERVGTLEEGKEADVIVVDGNPVDDLQALSRVEMTLVQGNLMHSTGRYA
jgi:imidazolonepropionase-like amidohydrolase